jgi:hypothetical protein
LRLMHRLAIWKILALLATLLSGVVRAEVDAGFEDVDGPNVRVVRHADGSRTRFTRTPDSRTLTKKKYGPEGKLIMVTIYRMDTSNNPIGCKIYDGLNNMLFKVSYGYHKDLGRLVEERMFDARVKRTDPDTGKEMPVQVVKYVYDADGNRSAPMVFNLLPGKSYEEVFGEKSTMYDKNPFQEEQRDLGNPKSRPLRQP